MRHELPIGIGDPFLLAVVDGKMHVAVSDLDRAARRGGGARRRGARLRGARALRAASTRACATHEIDLELASRAAAAIGLREAIADPEMPVAIADRLRADGIVLDPDHDAVAARRRVKSDAELAGIRRAQVAAEAGIAPRRSVLAPGGSRRRPARGRRRGRSRPRRARRAARRLPRTRRAGADRRHRRRRSGRAAATSPARARCPRTCRSSIDLWPRDEEIRLLGGHDADVRRRRDPEAVRAQETLVRTALERAREAVRPGITGRELHTMACDVFEAAGHRTSAPARATTRTRASSSRSATASASRCTRSPALGLTGREPAGRRRRDRHRAGAVGARHRRGAARRPAARHRGRQRDADALPVRPHALSALRRGRR